MNAIIMDTHIEKKAEDQISISHALIDSKNCELRQGSIRTRDNYQKYPMQYISSQTTRITLWSTDPNELRTTHKIHQQKV